MAEQGFQNGAIFGAVDVHVRDHGLTPDFSCPKIVQGSFGERSGKSLRFSHESGFRSVSSWI